MFLPFWISMFSSSITSGGTPLWATKAQFSTEPNWAFLNFPFYCLLSLDRCNLLAAPGYPYFLRSSEGYAYGWWLRELIETTSPLLAGFSLSW